MTIKPETLDFIYKHTIGAPDKQLEGANALDSKVAQIFAASAIVIGLAGITIESNNSSSVVNLIIAAVVAFAGVGLITIVQLWPRNFKQSLHAETLWPEHWDEDVQDIQHALVDDIAKAFKANKSILRCKRITLWSALLLCSFEVIFVGWALVVAFRDQAPP